MLRSSETTYEYLTRRHLVICQTTSDSEKMFKVLVMWPLRVSMSILSCLGSTRLSVERTLTCATCDSF